MLKPIVIDGSNVALSHGNNTVFSCKGIQICINWFRNRGHREIKAFVPSWRKENPRSKNQIIDQKILYELEREDFLVFTPSRWICGKRIICYDDRYILKFAADIDGIVVSNDNYRDLQTECEEYRKIVQERVLMYSFVQDRFMPPDDPLGRTGPSLDEFLQQRNGSENLIPICPYGKKCTYGYKCKYRHLNDDYNLNHSKHSPLRKSVSAPPYLDNQNLSKSRTKLNFPDLKPLAINICSLTNESEFAESHSDDCKSSCEGDIFIGYQKNFLDKSTEQSAFPNGTISHLKSMEIHSRNPSCLHKPLAPALSDPVTTVQHKKLSRLYSSPYVQQAVGIIEVEDDATVAEKRTHLYFHLSNVFSKEHVDTVFRNYPKETNPNVLCEALIKLNKF